jgi:hypothetical protein
VKRISTRTAAFTAGAILWLLLPILVVTAALRNDAKQSFRSRHPESDGTECWCLAANPAKVARDGKGSGHSAADQPTSQVSARAIAAVPRGAAAWLRGGIVPNGWGI